METEVKRLDFPWNRQIFFLIVTLELVFPFIFKSHKSSHRRCFVKKGALRNFAKLTGKHLIQSLFLNEVTDRPEAGNFIKREALALVFFCEFCNFSKNTFLQNTSGRLLLVSTYCTIQIHTESELTRVTTMALNSQHKHYYRFELWFFSCFSFFSFGSN